MSKKIVKKVKRAAKEFPILDKKSLLTFIDENMGRVTKRDIAAHFGIKGDDRRKLNALLRELDGHGEISLKRRKEITNHAAPPQSGIFEAIAIDEDGEVYAKSLGENGPIGPAYLVLRGYDHDKSKSIGVGERFVALARPNKIENTYELKIIRKISEQKAKVYGVLSLIGQHGGKVLPADKRQKHELIVLPQHVNDAKDGDLVAVRLLPSRGGYGPQKCEIVEILGNLEDPKSASILAIAAHNIPMGFTPAEELQAESAIEAPLDYRTDLRHIPFVTIDPDDARDHDDAVYAQKTEKGHDIWVAIADVAHYVPVDSPLDKGSIIRGNSVYFPDRVVPMLPFRLSADMCSLRENEDRASLCVRISVDDEGNLKGFEFYRALIRSKARLTYTMAQIAIDGTPDEKTQPLLDSVLKPLWAAYDALKIERAKRIPLEIDSNERRIVLSKEGKVESITMKERFDAHRLIEEFMILANVCAATALENKGVPLIYRVHDMPAASKVAALGDFLATLNIRWAKADKVSPKRFNKILEIAKETEHRQTINEMILRTQAQAVYDTQNLGHFGLQLHKYAHFTSPIRRYADLTVHRALIDALDLGGIGYGEKKPTKEQLKRVAADISDCERRAMAAERDATDRYLAAYLSERIGAVFDGRITSVTGFGLFVRLDETMGDGLVPVRTLGDEYFFLDEAAHTLIGQYSGDRWQLGMRVKVRLMEAAPINGGLMFDMVSDPLAGEPPKYSRQKLGGSARPQRRSSRSDKPKTPRPDNAKPSRTPKNVRKGRRR